MNKQVWIWIIIAVILLAGIYYVAVSPGETGPENTDTNTSTVDNQPTERTQQQIQEQLDNIDLPQVVKSGISGETSVQCDFSGGETISSATAYLKNGNLRITSEASGSSNRQSISKDSKTWLWGSDQDRGIVLDASMLPQNSGSQVETHMKQLYLTSENQSCEESSVEDSLFEVPSDINFQDLSDLEEQVKNQQNQQTQN